jgi:hypothetical protein
MAFSFICESLWSGGHRGKATLNANSLRRNVEKARLWKINSSAKRR